MADFPYQHTKALLLEYLKDHPKGQYVECAEGVVRLAAQKGLMGQQAPRGRERTHVRELVRQLLWQLLVQGIIVFGMDESNQNWPFYRLTGHGSDVVDGQRSQPYDPDNFLSEFLELNPKADSTVLGYLKEAVRAFNHDCPMSAAMMVGCVSEKVILILHEAFEEALSDPEEKEKFQRSYHWTIHSRYKALKSGLDAMATHKRFPRNLAEAVASELPSAFEIIRRHRNAAGHPTLNMGINPDTVFLNLRILSEYVRCIYALVEYVEANGASTSPRGAVTVRAE